MGVFFVKQLGLNIQKKRIDAGFTQEEEVAFGANLSRFICQQLEKEESRPGTPANPSLATVMAVAQLLGVSMEEILPQSWPDLRAR